MAEVGGPLQYYWRAVSNADYTTSFVGYWHILAVLSLVSSVFLIFLSVLVYRADSSNGKNRFIALMLITESLRCATAMMYWVYSWPESSLDFLSNVRVIYYVMSLQLFFLYILTPTFYAKSAWTSRLSQWFSTHGLYTLPLCCIGVILALSGMMGGTHVAIGDIGWTYCAAAGSGVGSTASGGSMPFDVTCPESWSAVYPVTLSSPTLGPLTQMLLFLPTIGAVFAATMVTKMTRKGHITAHDNDVELRAVRLGFIGKASLQITSIMMLFILIGVLGESPTLNTHPFNPDEQVPRLLIAVGPLLPTTVVLAALFEGVVFTYAMAKNEVFGIDEKLRKGFTTAVFTGSFAFLFLFATEGMETVFDKGWVGGILIGLPLIVLRKPILVSLERVSKLIMPESFTKDELGYIALYNAAMVDDVLTEKERSMLDIQAVAYGISPTRVEFLEAYADAKDSEEE
tara:strand:- start:91 stop:1461 length:1371 start_codon:yes stop_codon:yes gene_type:complete